MARPKYGRNWGRTSSSSASGSKISSAAFQRRTSTCVWRAIQGCFDPQSEQSDACGGPVFLQLRHSNQALENTHLAALQRGKEAGGGPKVALPAGRVVGHQVSAGRHHFHALELGAHQEGLRGNSEGVGGDNARACECACTNICKGLVRGYEQAACMWWETHCACRLPKHNVGLLQAVIVPRNEGNIRHRERRPPLPAGRCRWLCAPARPAAGLCCPAAPAPVPTQHPAEQCKGLSPRPWRLSQGGRRQMDESVGNAGGGCGSDCGSGGGGGGRVLGGGRMGGETAP